MAEQNPEAAALQEQALTQARLRRQRWILAGIIVGVIVVVAVVAWVVYRLLQNPGTTANIRDIFIIFMAFESLIIGVALVILVIQIASLINLLQNEVKPILAATNETVNTLRGTTEFLSENLVEPVIKLNSTVAGLRRILEVFGLMK